MSGIPLIPLDYWKGLLLFKLKKWEAAGLCFEAACLRNPDHPDSHFKRGLILIKLRNWQDAFPYIQRALVLDPSRVSWLVQFRNVIKNLGALRPAPPLIDEDELQRYIEERPDNWILYSELARLLRASGKWWQEIEALKSAVKCDPTNPELHFRLGEALEGMKRFSEASVHYGEAARLKPGDPEWYYLAGRSLSSEGLDGPPDRAKAAAFYQQAINAQKKDNLAKLGIGVFHQNACKWQLAAEAYEELIEAGSNFADLHYRLGTCHHRCFEWKLAEKSYTNAVALDGSFPKWHFRLGVVRERLRQYRQSAECYRKATELSTKHISLWYYRLGYVLEMDGDFESATCAYLKSRCNGIHEMEIEPVPAENNDGNDGQRTVMADPADDPSGSRYWWDLGRSLEMQTDWTGASDAYRQAVMRNDEHEPLLYYRLGYCLSLLGRHAEACGFFRNSRIFQRACSVPEEYPRGNYSWRKAAAYTEYYDQLQIQDNMVLYESFHGGVMSCNPYALFLEIVERVEFKDWTHVWVIDDKRRIPERFKDMGNVYFVSRDSDAYMRYLSTAKFLINNNTFPNYFTRKEEQIYLNTWHGTPWKTLGRDINNDFMAHGNAARNFLNATHIISPNRHTTEVLIKRYDVDGLFGGVIAETGYPRIDLTLNCTESMKSLMRERLGIAASSKVVLYAPTWRGTLANPEFDGEEFEREVARLASTGCHVLFRGHLLGGTLAGNVVVPDDISTNELLAIVDLLITDYSSIAFDFMATGRPIIYFLKDYQDYHGSRGLYFGVEELPGSAVFDLDDLCSEVERQLSEWFAVTHAGYEAAKLRFCSFEDGSATKRVLDLVFSGGAGKVIEPAKKWSVLVYAGQFIPNGVTNSFLNLLNHLDYDRIQITLVIDPGDISRYPERLEQFEQLPKEVRVIPRVGRMNLTLEEKWIVDSFNRNQCLQGNQELFDGYKRCFGREFRRLYGNTGFNAAIEFTGYSSFWCSIVAFSPQGAVRYRSTYQHNDMFCEWKVRFPQLERLFSLYPYFDRLVSVCESTMVLNAGSLAERLGIPLSKFDYCENLLNPGYVLAKADDPIPAGEEALLFGTGKRVFISIGRLSVEKDHRKLIMAFSRLRKVRADAKLLIVGDGPLFPELTRLVKRLNLDGSVHLIGFRFNPFPYLKKSSCFVFSSNYEGQGLVLLESMILNKPIVSTDIVVCRSVITGRSGHLVENSVEGLNQGMTDFLEGRVEAAAVDFEPYQRNALAMFYRKSCGMPLP